MTGKDRKLNRRPALKLVLGFYNKNKQFSGSMDDNWKLYLAQFTSLCDEYKTDDKTGLANFVL